MPYAAEIEFSHSTTVPYEDELIVAGKAWRIGKYFVAVPISGYCSIVFKTPAEAKTLYKAASIGKTGGEHLITLIEAARIGGSGGATLTPFQLNRNKLDLVCRLLDITAGDNNAQTVVGDFETPPDYLSGENQGSQRSADKATSSFIYLKPDTVYAIKVQNLGTTVSNINLLMTIGVDV